jgi:predicted RecB family nuclease
VQRRDSRLLLSATDLVNFHECEHLSALDRAALDDESLKAQRTKPDDQAELFFRKGREFEASYLEELKRLHPGAGEVVEIAEPFKDPGKAAAETVAAMRAGASIIYQSTFVDGDLLGHADFLRKVDRHSALGNHGYEVIDTKLGRHAKASYVLQLAFYSDLLASVQQAEPHEMHVVLGERKSVPFKVSEYNRYFRRLLQRFKASIGAPPTGSSSPPARLGTNASLGCWRAARD